MSSIQETVKQIAKSAFYILGAFKYSFNTYYRDCFWEETPQHIKQLYYGGIYLVLSDPNNITPKNIHDYWNEWAKIYKPNHKCLVPFEELPMFEKQKDFLFIQVVKSFLIEL